MNPVPFKSRRTLGAAILTLLAGGIAGWWSVRPSPEGAEGAIPSLSLPTAFSSKPDAILASGMADRALSSTVSSRLEREMLAALDPAGSGEKFTGDRLAELCLRERSLDLPGLDPAWAYAFRWAKAAPEEMLAWFRAHGYADLSLPTGPTSRNAFAKAIFFSLAKKDPERAISLAMQEEKPRIRRDLIAGLIETLRLTDPARAAALAGEQVALLGSGASSVFSAVDGDYGKTWDLLQSLPAGPQRNKVLAQYFNALAGNEPQEVASRWKAMPDAERLQLVEGGFRGFGLLLGEETAASSAALPGLDEMWRNYAVSSGDPEVLAKYLRIGAVGWAKTDPAAAITWAMDHLKGEDQVLGTARLFREGAANHFDATLAAWQALPDGGLRARAAGELAAGAPADRKAEAEALVSSLPPADQARAGAAAAEKRGSFRLGSY